MMQFNCHDEDAPLYFGFYVGKFTNYFGFYVGGFTNNGRHVYYKSDIFLIIDPALEFQGRHKACPYRSAPVGATLVVALTFNQGPD